MSLCKRALVLHFYLSRGRVCCPRRCCGGSGLAGCQVRAVLLSPSVGGVVSVLSCFLCQASPQSRADYACPRGRALVGGGSAAL